MRACLKVTGNAFPGPLPGGATRRGAFRFVAPPDGGSSVHEVYGRRALPDGRKELMLAGTQAPANAERAASFQPGGRVDQIVSKDNWSKLASDRGFSPICTSVNGRTMAPEGASAPR